MNSHQRRVARRRQLRARFTGSEFIRRAARAVLPLAAVALLVGPSGLRSALRLVESVVGRVRCMSSAHSPTREALGGALTATSTQ